jgi:hypothetical protein
MIFFAVASSSPSDSVMSAEVGRCGPCTSSGEQLTSTIVFLGSSSAICGPVMSCHRLIRAMGGF